MSRTLRGFDTEFPYLGARGDVTDADVPDAGLVAKEEDYGSDMYFDIGDRVASEMFGADDSGFHFGAHGFDNFGASSQGAAGTMLEHRYGVQAPAGFEFGPQGQLMRPKAPKAPPPQDPQAAAQYAKLVLEQHHWTPSIAHKAVWDITGGSWQVGVSIPTDRQPGVDKLMAKVAQKYNVFLFKARNKAGGGVTYVFSMSPRSAPIGGKVAGMSLKALSRPT